MKRWVALLMAALLLIGSACAETALESAPVGDAAAALDPTVTGEDASPDGGEIAAKGAAASKGPVVLTVTKKCTVTLYVGNSYRINVPGETVKSCKSGNSKVVKATKSGLLTPRKAGKAKITVKLKSGGKIVLTVKARKKAVELSGYCGKDAKKSAKKLGLNKKEDGVSGTLKYTQYYRGGVTLYNFHGAWDQGQVDSIVIEKGKKYSLIGVTVGMALKDAKKILKKYEDIDSFHDFGGQLYYVIEWEGDHDYPHTDLAVFYKNGKVTKLVYGVYID